LTQILVHSIGFNRIKLVQDVNEGFLCGLVVAGIEGGSVVDAVLDRGVPDHDPAEVLFNNSLGQLLKSLATRNTLGSQQNGVLGYASLDGEP
jgi:hypothetical protein